MTLNDRIGSAKANIHMHISPIRYIWGHHPTNKLIGMTQK